MKIALTYTGTPIKNQNYINWLKGPDEIEIIRISAEDDNLEVIESCDALVMSGGKDIHPKFYGSETGYTGGPDEFDEKRDAFEMAAFRSAQKNNLPVLGICRGMQLINVIQGGTMIQDLPTEVPVKTHNGNPDNYHEVYIEKNTLLHDITAMDKGIVNSAHHQGIDKMGEDLMVNSKAADGTIEGVEWKDKSGKPFMLAVQWHPERMFEQQQSPLTQAIRDRFISEIRKSISQKQAEII